MAKKTILTFALLLSLRVLCYPQNAALPVADITRLFPIEKMLVHLNNGKPLILKNWQDHVTIAVTTYTDKDTSATHYKYGTNTKSYDPDGISIFITKLLGNDSIAVFRFGETSPHSYWYMLLKDNNRYTILNVDDIKEDWGKIDVLLKKIQGNISYESISRIIYDYIRNANYHPTPPFPDLKAKKSEKRAPTYPKRKFTETEPFYFGVH